MFGIAFDLTVKITEANHPKGSASAAYSEIASTLAKFGFNRIQHSLYVCTNDDLANLFNAIQALKALSWMPVSVKDIRAFKLEQWSDFTPSFKALVPPAGP